MARSKKIDTKKLPWHVDFHKAKAEAEKEKQVQTSNKNINGNNKDSEKA